MYQALIKLPSSCCFTHTQRFVRLSFDLDVPLSLCVHQCVAPTLNALVYLCWSSSFFACLPSHVRSHCWFGRIATFAVPVVKHLIQTQSFRGCGNNEFLFQWCRYSKSIGTVQILRNIRPFDFTQSNMHQQSNDATTHVPQKEIRLHNNLNFAVGRWWRRRRRRRRRGGGGGGGGGGSDWCQSQTLVVFRLWKRCSTDINCRDVSNGWSSFQVTWCLTRWKGGDTTKHTKVMNSGQQRRHFLHGGHIQWFFMQWPTRTSVQRQWKSFVNVVHVLFTNARHASMKVLWNWVDTNDLNVLLNDTDRATQYWMQRLCGL